MMSWERSVGEAEPGHDYKGLLEGPYLLFWDEVQRTGHAIYAGLLMGGVMAQCSPPRYSLFPHWEMILGRGPSRGRLPRRSGPAQPPIAPAASATAGPSDPKVKIRDIF